MELLEELQPGGLRILQKAEGFRFGMDSVLLADFADIRSGDAVADFGTGTGILPLLLISRGKGAVFTALELQQDMADMAARSMALNGLEDRVKVLHLPVEEAESAIAPCSLDAVICNPPYGMPGTTLQNPSEERRLARHQTEDGLRLWLRTAFRLLKGKGRMAIVYPAPRMLQVMRDMEDAHLAPKRFRLVYPRQDKPAKLVLIEAQKDAKPMLHPMPPLIVYQADGSPTEELRRIYRE
ncbi:MAG: tRNA1(Val) (adenine(37)-N6)-methyltransferase [Clostridia bacterium]|nr:tRNA1(Val) (adenine(37)-N6)-methyltransferase [Clostridia bacterium]